MLGAARDVVGGGGDTRRLGAHRLGILRDMAHGLPQGFQGRVEIPAQRLVFAGKRSVQRGRKVAAGETLEPFGQLFHNAALRRGGGRGFPLAPLFGFAQPHDLAHILPEADRAGFAVALGDDDGGQHRQRRAVEVLGRPFKTDRLIERELAGKILDRLR